MAKSYVKLTKKSKPEVALELPSGTAVFSGSGLPIMSRPSPEQTVEAATVIIKNGGHSENFYSQAGIVAFASKKYGDGSVEL